MVLTGPSLNRRRIAQKIALTVAYACYTAMLFILCSAAYWAMQEGTDNPIFASLIASVVFLAGSGIVLQVIGKVDLPDLSIKGDSRQDGKHD